MLERLPLVALMGCFDPDARDQAPTDELDHETDGDTDADSDSDTDADADADTDADSDTDTDPAHTGDTASPDVDLDGFTVAEGDCDDHDYTSHPGAADTYGDGTDQNCDDADGVDGDGDGAASTNSGGDDCDDRDDERFPNNPEVCEDGVDQDCSGADRPCPTWLYTIRLADDVLRRVDVDTMTWEDIGPLGVSVDLGDMAYDEASSTLYMIDGRAGANALYTVDMATGAATRVGVHGVNNLMGLAWDPVGGVLYASRSTSGLRGWFTLNPSTAYATGLGDPGSEIGALGFDTSRDTFFGSYAVVTTFALFDRYGTATPISVPYGVAIGAGDGAWEPVHDRYWFITYEGNLLYYNARSPAGQSIRAQGLGPHEGLAYVPNPPN